jgi:hypothetical protein
MSWLYERVAEAGHIAIADFICPTSDTRAAFGTAFMIWVDRIFYGMFNDTNELFSPPHNLDVRIDTSGSAKTWADAIYKKWVQITSQ